MDYLNPELLGHMDKIGEHIEAIKNIIAGISGPVHKYSFTMMAAHQILDLPHDDIVAYQALEKIYFHFHNMEGLNNGKRK